MPRLDRRALLGAGAAGVAAATAGCLGGSSVSLTPWTPATDSWPLARYDPGNTAHNPSAAPSRNGVEEAWRVETDVEVRGLAVAAGRVVGFGSDGLVAVTDGPAGDTWATDAPAGAAGFGPRDGHGRVPLYAAGHLGHEGDAAVWYLRDWRLSGAGRATTFVRTHRTRADEPAHLVTGADGVYVGHEPDRVVAVDPTDGSARWRAGGSRPGLTDGWLVDSEVGAVHGYRPRSGLDARFNGGPKAAWTAPAGATTPAVADGRAVVGEFHEPGAPARLFGYDPATGEPLWEPRPLGDSVSAPAVVGDTAYVGVVHESDGPVTGGSLVAVDLTDGSTRWRRDGDWGHWQPVAAGNGVVLTQGVAPGGAAGGRLRAYDADTGGRLWTREVARRVQELALVGDRVYVGSADGTITALR